ncbi:MAG: hypothetical protein HZB59_01630 [Ignavibacteriales bacterium]|nr:hypothetical protein [Ignavibacteriales bacterium]
MKKLIIFTSIITIAILIVAMALYAGDDKAAKKETVKCPMSGKQASSKDAKATCPSMTGDKAKDCAATCADKTAKVQCDPESKECKDKMAKGECKHGSQECKDKMAKGECKHDSKECKEKMAKGECKPDSKECKEKCSADCKHEKGTKK